MYSKGTQMTDWNIITTLKISRSKCSRSLHFKHILAVFLFPDDYDLPVCLNKLKLDTQADITDIMVEFVDKVDPLSRF